MLVMKYSVSMLVMKYPVSNSMLVMKYPVSMLDSGHENKNLSKGSHLKQRVAGKGIGRVTEIGCHWMTPLLVPAMPCQPRAL